MANGSINRGYGATVAVGGARTVLTLAMLAVAFGVLVYLFRDSLASMVHYWGREEYSHGFMIPLVAAWLVWQRADQLKRVDWQPTRLAPLLLLASLFGGLLGELSSLFVVGQYAFVVGIWGLALALLGRRGFVLCAAGFVYLLFMIPLPNFLYNNLSSFLQLVSTDIGVAVIRLLGVSVFVEGNVIDLGVYKLQVVEACSGLRYLFPLMSFGFLMAVLYRGAFWQRALLFLSTLPITVLMNSLRIGVIGVTVDRYGIQAAEGFLHFFEGWVVFLACLAVLVALAWALDRFSAARAGVLGRLDLHYPSPREVSAARAGERHTRRSVAALLALLLLMVPLSLQVDAREELIPARPTFARFPLMKDGWLGRDGFIAPDVLDALRLTDHLVADYRRPEDPAPVNLYIAYYASQRAGASIHSPRSCMPGGGWRITSLERTDVSDVLGYRMAPVNRAVIELGDARQLVYYWFEQRGRVISNEYFAKWYLFWDSLTRARSDGALVRVVTPVGLRDGLAGAEARLHDFLRVFHPELRRFVPGHEVTAVTAGAAS
mgnify:CR=1 FL=1